MDYVSTNCKSATMAENIGQQGKTGGIIAFWYNDRWIFPHRGVTFTTHS
jgi:hypothetical protein